MDRREFLASAMGMATSLSVVNLVTACSSDSNSSGKKSDAGFIDMGSSGGGGRASGSSGKGGAGGFNIPDAATMDCDIAEAMVNGHGEFILDIQTHHIEDQG